MNEKENDYVTDKPMKAPLILKSYTHINNKTKSLKSKTYMNSKTMLMKDFFKQENILKSEVFNDSSIPRNNSLTGQINDK